LDLSGKEEKRNGCNYRNIEKKHGETPLSGCTAENAVLLH
jgi:hypothetical protein